MEHNACKVRIEGVVQGVGFRFFTEDKARQYGVTGYVKNMYDGSVEVYAEGSDDILKQFIGVLREGPRMARVEKTDVKWLQTEKKYDSFTIAY